MEATSVGVPVTATRGCPSDRDRRSLGAKSVGVPGTVTVLGPCPSTAAHCQVGFNFWS